MPTPDTHSSDGSLDHRAEYARAIDDAESYEELLAVINHYGEIEGSRHTFSVGRLTTAIVRIRELQAAGHPVERQDFRCITRSLGLRYRVKALYQDAEEGRSHG